MRWWWRALVCGSADADSGTGAGGARSHHRWRGDGHCRFAVGRFLTRYRRPGGKPHLAAVTSSYATVFAGWERIRVEPPTDLDPWSRHHLDDFCRVASRGLGRLGGDSLLHADIRADNLVIHTDGTVAVVDWPWACIGAAWFDQLLLCVNVDLYGG